MGRYVDAGVSGVPLRPHPHRPRQDVRAATDLHSQGDGVCKLTTGGRSGPFKMGKLYTLFKLSALILTTSPAPSWTETTQSPSLTSASVTTNTRRCTCPCDLQSSSGSGPGRRSFQPGTKKISAFIAVPVYR